MKVSPSPLHLQHIIPQLGGVTRGLSYIHSRGMIHGDLKGVRLRWSDYTAVLLTHIKANILIDKTGQARLADFGLLTIVSDPTNLFSSSSYTQGGTARWMSPELIDPQRFGFEDNRPTKNSDCYALGMVVYETISGHVPFHKHGDYAVIVKVLAGEHPPRGVGFAETLWEMLELCWRSHPNNRPTIEDVHQCLEKASNPSESPPPVVGEDMEMDGDDWDSTSDSSGMFYHSAHSAEFWTQCSTATDLLC